MSLFNSTCFPLSVLGIGHFSFSVTTAAKQCISESMRGIRKGRRGTPCIAHRYTLWVSYTHRARVLFTNSSHGEVRLEEITSKEVDFCSFELALCSVQFMVVFSFPSETSV